MARYSPQDKYFNIMKKIESIKTIVFYISIIGSVIVPLLNSKIFNSFFTIISIAVLLMLELQSDKYRHKAQKSRRNDLLDNAFGTNFNYDRSSGYFTNDEVSEGMYKLGVDIFQNCFWSLEISNKMKVIELIKMCIGAIAILLLAIIGFANNVLSIPVLQIFLSGEFIAKYIKIAEYNSDLEVIFNELKELFDNKNKELIEKEDVKLLKIILSYECNTSNYKIDLDTNIFRKVNQDLEVKWATIKKIYKIN